MPKQLAFNFTPPNEATFKNFYPGSNQVLFDLIQKFSHQSTIFSAYLWGATGTGKTHLLQAACYDGNDQINPETAYLSLNDLKDASPKLLDGLELLSLVCIDDIDVIAGNSVWEEALFHFYNRIEAQGGHLLFSSAINPKNLSIQLPDLKSRIAASFVMEIKPLSDKEKLLVLQTRAQARGFDLSEDVAEFLLTHFPRDMDKLMHILNQLDESSLVEKRRITIPFVKKALGD